MKHEGARGGFSNNPTINEVVHEFGECSRHLSYDRGSARLQGIYKTVNSKWSSMIDRAYEGTTIPVLHVRRWCPCYAIQVVVHDTRLEPSEGSCCMAR